MKKFLYYGLFLLFIGTACHNKSNNASTNNGDTSVSTNTANAPVQISPDDSLQNGVRDALKDYPGVTGNVSNGEITLTGDINRDRLTPLMQSLHNLHPKKINNNLNIK
ncbi:MAG: hypothetical protein ACJ748_05745 [Flavisolibacter sp.]